MWELLAAFSLFRLAQHRAKPSPSKPDQHPSLKPRQYEIVSREIWDKHNRSYAGPNRKRTSEFYLSRHVSKKVKKLPKSLPF